MTRYGQEALSLKGSNLATGIAVVPLPTGLRSTAPIISAVVDTIV
jgi:hypothetical protein